MGRGMKPPLEQLSLLGQSVLASRLPLIPSIKSQSDRLEPQVCGGRVQGEHELPILQPVVVLG